MAKPLAIPIPDQHNIGPNYTIRVTGIDPTTGAAVSGITVNQVVLTVELVDGTVTGLESGKWYLVPGPGA